MDALASVRAHRAQVACTGRRQHERFRGGERNRTAVQGFAVPCLNHSATPPERATVLSAAGPPGANATLADASGTDWGTVPGVGVRELRTPERPCSKTPQASSLGSRAVLGVIGPKKREFTPKCARKLRRGAAVRRKHPANPAQASAATSASRSAAARSVSSRFGNANRIFPAPMDRSE